VVGWGIECQKWGEEKKRTNKNKKRKSFKLGKIVEVNSGKYPIAFRMTHDVSKHHPQVERICLISRRM
jgi:hypothetical protein